MRVSPNKSNNIATGSEKGSRAIALRVSPTMLVVRRRSGASQPRNLFAPVIIPTISQSITPAGSSAAKRSLSVLRLLSGSESWSLTSTRTIPDAPRGRISLALIKIAEYLVARLK